MDTIIFSAPERCKWDGVFSNFTDAWVDMDGIKYPTVEHAYQAAKTSDVNQRVVVSECATPGKAKRIGQQVMMREDWQSVKYDIMVELLKQKFTYEHYKKDLLSTGDAQIVESAAGWNDTEWGIGADGSGKNLLGRALMEVREWLKNK